MCRKKRGNIRHVTKILLYSKKTMLLQRRHYTIKHNFPTNISSNPLLLPPRSRLS